MSPETIVFKGTWLELNVTVIHAGWNIVGSVSGPVDVSTITTSPPGLVASQFFGYENGYSTVTTIHPGKATWVKIKPPGGTIYIPGKTYGGSYPKPLLAESKELVGMNHLTITDVHGNGQALYLGREDRLTVPADYYDLPPVPPQGIFDVRFSSGRMVETYGTMPEQKKPQEYQILLQGVTYPITMSFKASTDEPLSLLVNDGAGKKIGSGLLTDGRTLKISDSRITVLRITMAEGVAIPKEYALDQNYPNPFNPATTLKYQLPFDSKVTLRIYNILGQEVVTLADEIQEAGYKMVAWNGENLASGVYFYRLDATSVTEHSKSFSQVKKMLLLK